MQVFVLLKLLTGCYVSHTVDKSEEVCAQTSLGRLGNVA